MAPATGAATWRCAIARALLGKQDKVFFSEEKKQKTFIFQQVQPIRPWPGRIRWRRLKSLLVLFFRKERSLISFQIF
jgi:hypothetical protein